MSSSGQAFIDAVLGRLRSPLSEAGFVLNDTQIAEDEVSVLFEGVVSDFLGRYPGLDPTWDQEWRSHPGGCVDLWIKWNPVDDVIRVDLEHWPIAQLAERYGDDALRSQLDSAIRSSGPIEKRVAIIADTIETALRGAAC